MIVLFSTFEQHLKDLNAVFQQLRNAGFKLGPKKCTFGKSECIFLSHQISSTGIWPPPDRVRAIHDYPLPSSAKEL